MPCDGKNPNCDRRRELLAQLKCLVSSMDKKKPCEWDEPDCPPPTCCPVCPNDSPPCCSPVKACKSFELRNSLMYRCDCIKRNGLQDSCMMWDCMGRPECMTKLYPVCGPGRGALLKLTDLGDVEVALRKFYCADQARESALAAYCRLSCGANGCGGPPCQSGGFGMEEDQCCSGSQNGGGRQQSCCSSASPSFGSSGPPSCCSAPASCCPPAPTCCPQIRIEPTCCPPPATSCCPQQRNNIQSSCQCPVRTMLCPAC
ncbi:keratin-associated protein 10-4 [Venturia canescens]|uniref:keratin-associated protein 10-4 n=1 Tax=Venturia canescens TaxID=32260 RepID=UPI001C9BDBE3|nr:keratin-associated protein 10-4 [Venturia canescens]